MMVVYIFSHGFWPLVVHHLRTVCSQISSAHLWIGFSCFSLFMFFFLFLLPPPHLLPFEFFVYCRDSDEYLAKFVSHSANCLLLQFAIFFAVQKIFTSIKSHLSLVETIEAHSESRCLGLYLEMFSPLSIFLKILRSKAWCVSLRRTCSDHIE